MKLCNVVFISSLLALVPAITLAESNVAVPSAGNSEPALDYGYGSGAAISPETKQLNQPSVDAASLENNPTSPSVDTTSLENKLAQLPVDVLAGKENTDGEPASNALNAGAASPSIPQPPSNYANSPPGPANEYECIEDEVDNNSGHQGKPIPGCQSSGHCGAAVTVTATVVATSTQLVTTTCTLTRTKVVPTVTTVPTTITRIATQQVVSTLVQVQTQQVTQTVDRTVTKTRHFTVTQTLPGQCGAEPTNTHAVEPDCSTHGMLNRHDSRCRQPQHHQSPARHRYPEADSYGYDSRW